MLGENAKNYKNSAVFWEKPQFWKKTHYIPTDNIDFGPDFLGLGLITQQKVKHP